MQAPRGALSTATASRPLRDFDGTVGRHCCRVSAFAEAVPVPNVWQPPDLLARQTSSTQAGPGPGSQAQAALSAQRRSRHEHQRAERSAQADVWEPPRLDHHRLTSIIKNCGSPTQLLEVVQQHQDFLNVINLAAAFSRTTAFHRQPELRAQDARTINSQLLPLLIKALRERMGQMAAPRALATVVHSLGYLDVRERELLMELAKLAEPIMPTFSTQGLANMLWAFARCSFQPPSRWMDSFVSTSQSLLVQFDPQELTTTLWSLSRLKYKLSPDTQQEFLQRARNILPRCSPHSLALLAYTMGSTEVHPSQDYLDDLVQAMLQAPGLQKFTPQGICQFLWALGRMGYHPSPAFTAAVTSYLDSPMGIPSLQAIDIATTLHALVYLELPLSLQLHRRLMARWQDCMFSMQPTQLANSGWAVAHLQRGLSQRQPDRLLMFKYLSACYSSMERFTHRDLAMTAWGLATLGCKLPPAFLHAMQRRMEQVGAEFEPQEVANTLWALARLGASPSASLMVEFFAATDKRLSSFKPQELSTMIWALAKVHYLPNKAWADEFLRAAFHRMAEFSPQGLSNTAWALGSLGVAAPPAWLYAYVKVASSPAAWDQLGVLDLRNMVQGLRALNASPTGLGLQRVDEFVEQAVARLQAMADAEGAALAVAAPASPGGGSHAGPEPGPIAFTGLSAASSLGREHSSLAAQPPVAGASYAVDAGGVQEVGLAAVSEVTGQMVSEVLVRHRFPATNPQQPSQTPEQQVGLELALQAAGGAPGCLPQPPLASTAAATTAAGAMAGPGMVAAAAASRRAAAKRAASSSAAPAVAALEPAANGVQGAQGGAGPARHRAKRLWQGPLLTASRALAHLSAPPTPCLGTQPPGAPPLPGLQVQPPGLATGLRASGAGSGQVSPAGGAAGRSASSSALSTPAAGHGGQGPRATRPTAAPPPLPTPAVALHGVSSSLPNAAGLQAPLAGPQAGVTLGAATPPPLPQSQLEAHDSSRQQSHPQLESIGVLRHPSSEHGESGVQPEAWLGGAAVHATAPHATSGMGQPRGEVTELRRSRVATAKALSSGLIDHRQAALLTAAAVAHHQQTHPSSSNSSGTVHASAAASPNADASHSSGVQPVESTAAAVGRQAHTPATNDGIVAGCVQGTANAPAHASYSRHQHNGGHDGQAHDAAASWVTGLLSPPTTHPRLHLALPLADQPAPAAAAPEAAAHCSHTLLQPSDSATPTSLLTVSTEPALQGAGVGSRQGLQQSQQRPDHAGNPGQAMRPQERAGSLVRPAALQISRPPGPMPWANQQVGPQISSSSDGDVGSSLAGSTGLDRATMPTWGSVSVKESGDSASADGMHAGNLHDRLYQVLGPLEPDESHAKSRPPQASHA